jgi:hypothetical protein
MRYREKEIYKLQRNCANENVFFGDIGFGGASKKYWVSVF